jgi:TonB-linked SusC/RagA family outer membrane protein
MDKKIRDMMNGWMTRIVLGSIVLCITSAAVLGQSSNNRTSANLDKNGFLVLYNGLQVNQDISKSAVLNKLITLEVKDVPLLEVLNKIAEEADLEIVYDSKLLESIDRNITLSFKYKTVKNALWTALKGTGLRFAVSEDKQLIIMRHEEEKQENQVIFDTVSGTVTDAQTGEVLPGVNVVVIGSQEATGSIIGTTTDINGEYDIEVPDELNVLRFSFVGYQTQEVPIDGENQINIELAAQAVSGEEVVVVGYGTQQKRDLTSSITSVSGEDIANVRTSSVDQALQGQVPGAIITRNTGAPGGDVTIRLRGYGTASAGGNNAPLIVVDGVPTQQGLNQLDPNNIQSIDILKDAASASVYGVQAANGVVVVTTKQGRPGQTQVTFDAYGGISQPWKDGVPVLTAREHAELNNKIFSILNEGLTPDHPSYATPPEFYANPSSLENPGTDWQEAIYRDAAPFQNYYLGISGGSEQTQYAVSLGHRVEDGIIRNSSMDKYNVSANLDHDVTSYFDLGARFSYNARSIDEVPTNFFDGIPYNAIKMPRFLPVKADNGNWGAPPGLGEWSWGDAKNPVARAALSNDNNENNSLTGNLSGQFNFLNDNLAVESFFGFARFFGGSSNFNDPYPRTQENWKNPQDASISESSYNNLNYNWDNTITYLGELANHSFNAVVGTSYQFENSSGIFSSQDGFENRAEPYRYFGFGDPGTFSVGSYESERTLFSYFGRLNYDYNNKYLAQIVVRRDASSVFSKENRWGTFPAASLGWRISEESFLRDVNFINDLKLRGSWGQSGNQDVGDTYPTFDRIGVGELYVLGGSVRPGIAPLELGNSDITWEKNEQFNVGLDLSILRNSISFTIDYYERRTKDMLIKIPIPGITGGAAAPAQNVGSVLNKGLEFSLSFNKVVNNDFSFIATANAATITNRVTDLAGIDFILPPAGSINQAGTITRAIEGHSISQYYGYKFAGVFQNQAQVDCAFDPNCSDYAVPDASEDAIEPGDAIWQDVSGPDGVPDGIISDDDRTTLGDAIPDMTFGLNLSVNYKNFDLRTLIQGVSGVQVYNQLIDWAGRKDNGANSMRRALNYWDGEGSTNKHTRLVSEGAGNWRESDRMIEDGDYIRVRNLEVGYALPTNLTTQIGIQNLRIYIASSNLFTITGYSGLEPEVGQNTNSFRQSGNSDLQLGIDTGVYPQPRTFTIGTRIQF